jgi:hypothetical protein
VVTLPEAVAAASPTAAGDVTAPPVTAMPTPPVTATPIAPVTAGTPAVRRAPTMRVAGTPVPAGRDLSWMLRRFAKRTSAEREPADSEHG